MAMTDYFQCARCEAKALYGAEVNWWEDEDSCNRVAALCVKCAQDHVLVVAPLVAEGGVQSVDPTDCEAIFSAGSRARRTEEDRSPAAASPPLSLTTFVLCGRQSPTKSMIFRHHRAPRRSEDLRTLHVLYGSVTPDEGTPPLRDSVLIDG